MIEVKVYSLTKRMKAIVLVLSLLFSLSFISAPASHADSLEVLGGQVTWPDKMYVDAIACSNYTFQYKNNSTGKLRTIGFIITDPFGRKVAQNYNSIIQPNALGVWNTQICGHQFKNGLGPYIMKVYAVGEPGIEFETTKEIYFFEIPTDQPKANSSPKPVPTATVTAKPEPAPTVTLDPSLELLARISNLESQLKASQMKLKKVCSVKPKPKLC